VPLSRQAEPLGRKDHEREARAHTTTSTPGPCSPVVAIPDPQGPGTGAHRVSRATEAWATAQPSTFIGIGQIASQDVPTPML